MLAGETLSRATLPAMADTSRQPPDATDVAALHV